MSIDHRSSVYLTKPTSEFRICRTEDILLYATHLYAFLDSAAYASPGRVALEIGSASITYEALVAKVNLCASSYMSLGIEPGDTIVFSMSHSLALVVSMLAALKVGAKLCVLPENISVLRLRAIQYSTPIALLVYRYTQTIELDVRTFHVQSISYQGLMERSVYSNATAFYPHAHISAGQIIMAYDDSHTWRPVEFSQAIFLKMLHEIDDILPSQHAGEKMLMTAPATKPLFLLELFYVFMRQATAILEKPAGSKSAVEYPIKLPLIGAVRLFLEKSGWIKPCVTGLELQGLCASLGEIEYFARQYPGVSYAKADFFEQGLVLRVKFAWDFYPYPSVHFADMNNMKPASDIDRLVLRLHEFLSQHFWHALPLSVIVLEPV